MFALGLKATHARLLVAAASHWPCQAESCHPFRAMLAMTTLLWEGLLSSPVRAWLTQRGFTLEARGAETSLPPVPTCPVCPDFVTDASVPLVCGLNILVQPFWLHEVINKYPK